MALKTEAKLSLEKNGAEKDLVDKFDYDEYVLKKNKLILELAFTKLNFSVKDSEYYIVHPFD